jgi:hypothetical protein
MEILSIRRTSATFAALVFAFTSLISAHAQASYRVGAMNVPFAFEYGSHQFAAGEYTIARVGDKIISISNGTTVGMSMILPSLDQNAALRNKLVFDKVGSQYFLRQIYTAGSRVHAECRESKTEKQALVRQSVSHPENVEVATR